MIYKVISKPEFKAFIDAIVRVNNAYGPCLVDTGAKGEPIYQFKPVKSADEISFDYTVTHSSAKPFFLPFRDELSSFTFKRVPVGIGELMDATIFMLSRFVIMLYFELLSLTDRTSEPAFASMM